MTVVTSSDIVEASIQAIPSAHASSMAYHELATDWIVPHSRYEAVAWLCQESDGGFSIYCPRLPGVASQGETREEAIRMIEEALAGTIRSYLDSGDAIPWIMEEPQQDSELVEEVWIAVNV